MKWRGILVGLCLIKCSLLFYENTTDNNLEFFVSCWWNCQLCFRGKRLPFLWREILALKTQTHHTWCSSRFQIKMFFFDFFYYLTPNPNVSFLNSSLTVIDCSFPISRTNLSTSSQDPFMNMISVESTGAEWISRILRLYWYVLQKTDIIIAILELNDLREILFFNR